MKQLVAAIYFSISFMVRNEDNSEINGKRETRRWETFIEDNSGSETMLLEGINYRGSVVV